jgi:hypothetical protein
VIGVLASASLYLAAAGLVVLGEGNGKCPGAASVSTRLAELLGDEPGAEAPDALVIDGAPGALRVRLLSAQGTLREEKTLDLEGTCDELADAVATVAVAWRSQLQADDVPPPVLAPVQQVYAGPPPAPPPSPPPVVEPELEISYGVGTISGDQRWAPGLLLAAQAPFRGGFSTAFTLSVPAPRAAQDLFGKDWRWLELTAIFAPSYRVVTDNLLFDSQLGLGAGLNITTSESLSAPDSYHLAPPALVAGVRWTYRHSRNLPWFGVTFSARALRPLESPIHNAAITSEPWWLGIALGGTLAFERTR